MKFGRALALGITLSALTAASSYAQTVGSDEPYTGPNGPYLRAEGGWYGETDLRVPTGDDVPQSQNRRVEIDIP